MPNATVDPNVVAQIVEGVMRYVVERRLGPGYDESDRVALVELVLDILSAPVVVSEEMVERAAEAIYQTDYPGQQWDGVFPSKALEQRAECRRPLYRDFARAALTAVAPLFIPAPGAAGGAAVEAEEIIDAIRHAVGEGRLDAEDDNVVAAVERAVAQADRYRDSQEPNDTMRLDWLERSLFPLPWGGVYLLAEGGQMPDDTTHVVLTLNPSSGDAPIWEHGRDSLRDCIDAAIPKEPQHA